VSSRGWRLIAASTTSAAVVTAAPIMGQVRGLLRSAFPAYFVVIVGAAVAGAVITALVTAIVRIKTSRAARFAAIAAALVIGIGYSVASRSGIPDVDAVEHVHFIEYGLITILFYRAWREQADPSAFALPVLAALLVGTLDEWLQWFVPVRVGEMRDVLLNLVAISCGLLFGAAIEPPAAFSKRLRRESTVSVGVAGAAVVLTFAAFVSMAHLGHLVSTEKGSGSLFQNDRPEKAPGAFFKSHYTGDGLDALARDRAARWRTDPPVVLKRFSQEDQYMDEGLWHIRRRNEDWTAGNYSGAWNENLILERFYQPVLDTSSYALPGGGRWPAAQRADAAARTGAQAAPFVSDAQPYPVFIWPKPLFWSAVALVMLGALAFAWRAYRYPTKIV
jgi:hypothetical protein